MLIIEGPDMIGKTTLVAQIARMIRDRHHGFAPTLEKYSFEEIMYMTTKEWISRIKNWNIVDRFCPSALIYGPYYFHGKAKVSALNHGRVMREVKKRGGLLVVLYATESHYERLLTECYPTRHEAFPPDVCREGNRAYAKFAASALCNYSILLDGAGFAMDVAPDKIAQIVTAYMQHQVL